MVVNPDLGKGGAESPENSLLPLVHLLMAAAGDEKERDDKDPDPVIVEESAKAVVIHKISSLGDMCDSENAVLTIILCGNV